MEVPCLPAHAAQLERRYYIESFMAGANPGPDSHGN